MGVQFATGSLVRRVDARLAHECIRVVPIVADLEIEILGREMTCDALVMPAGSTPLIGKIPLERLDLVVNPKSGELNVNPASPDVPRLDLFARRVIALSARARPFRVSVARLA